MTELGHSGLRALLDRAVQMDEVELDEWLQRADRAPELRALVDNGGFDAWGAEAAARILNGALRLKLPGRLGSYEVSRHVASGGMGEVYEADDPRLKRKVAIKILHAGAIRQLEDEARALARLRHPNICRVYDVGRAEGVDYFVMEYLDGQPLSERLRQGPLDLGDAIAITRAIAGALAEAHRHGIVHRDVKPSNILLTRSGPSLIDFGIADQAAAAVLAAGTPEYMAPEQIRGLCDPRSDIYSLGAILKQMAGPEPPARIRELIESCLREDPEERWQSAADLARALDWIVAPPERLPDRRRRVWIAVAFATAAVALAFAAVARSRAPERVRVAIPLRGPQGNPIARMESIALSPDGTRVAFIAPGEGGEPLVWIRHIGRIDPEAVAASAGSSLVFWSPDGRSLGLVRGRRLQTLHLESGALNTVTEVQHEVSGADWAPGGWILYSLASIQKDGVVYRIAAGGGKPEPVTRIDSSLDEHSHTQPIALEDGRHFLYLARANPDTESAGLPGTTYLAAAGSSERTVVLRGALATAWSGGRVYYVRDGGLWSQALDIGSAKWTDAPREEAAPVRWARAGRSGAIVYAPSVPKGRPVWLDRTGKQVGELPLPEGEYLGVGLAADGKVLATRREQQSSAVGLWVVSGTEAQRLGSAPGGYIFPVWSPDGRWIYFARGKNLYRQQPAAGASAEELQASSEYLALFTIAPDGSYGFGVSYDVAARRGFDIFRFRTAGRKREVWSATAASETMPALSPDGRWVAWACEYGQRGRLCLSPAHNARAVTYLTDTAATFPQWSPDGAELYFLAGSQLTVMPMYRERGSIRGGPPRPLFRINPKSVLGANYTVASDGRILVIEPHRPPQDPVLVFQSPGSR